MDPKKLKSISEINIQKSITEKKNMKFLINKKEENKNIHFKPLNFNPTSFFAEKYSQDIPNIINKKKIINDIVKSDKKDNNSNINLNNNLTRKKLKLKPLNMNRSNFSTIFHPKVDDILIPSNKTTKDLVDYNKANTHNTLLNYYHKNNRNIRIINFVKTNSFDKNYGLNLTNKFVSSNESYNNNITNSIKNQNNNENTENSKPILKRSIKIQKSFSDIEKLLKGKRNFRKSRIDLYESEILAKREFLRNLNYFHDQFFKKEVDQKKHYKKLNPIFKEENQPNYDQINMSNSLKEKIYLENFNKNNFLFNSSFKYINRRKRNLNDRNNLSYKEMRGLSLQGFKRMKADKQRQFNIRLQNTNNEVLNLEHKLDELLEVNKQFFLNANED